MVDNKFYVVRLKLRDYDLKEWVDERRVWAPDAYTAIARASAMGSACKVILSATVDESLAEHVSKEPKEPKGCNEMTVERVVAYLGFNEEATFLMTQKCFDRLKPALAEQNVHEVGPAECRGYVRVGFPPKPAESEMQRQISDLITRVSLLERAMS